MQNIQTYSDLLTYLQSCSLEQLKQRVQICRPSPVEEEPVEACPGIAIGTMQEMGFYKARSVTNNKFVPEEIVLLIDGNPFAPDGAWAYTYDWDEEGKRIITPDYSPDGPTNPEDQLNPDYKSTCRFMPPHEVATIKNRLDNADDL